MWEFLAGALVFAAGLACGVYVSGRVKMPELPERVPHFGDVVSLDKAVYPPWDRDDPDPA